MLFVLLTREAGVCLYVRGAYVGWCLRVRVRVLVRVLIQSAPVTLFPPLPHQPVPPFEPASETCSPTFRVS